MGKGEKGHGKCNISPWMKTVFEKGEIPLGNNEEYSWDHLPLPTLLGDSHWEGSLYPKGLYLKAPPQDREDK